MAITGSATGLVTGPVTCVTIGLLNGGILLLPFSPLYGAVYGWEMGGKKDRDFAEFGRYDEPGTYPVGIIYVPFLFFPKGPDPPAVELRRSGESRPPTIEGEDSTSLSRTQHSEPPSR